jgi:hypothetical protein
MPTMSNKYALPVCLASLAATLVAATSLLHASPASLCTSPLNSNVGCEFYAVSMPNLFLTDTTTYHFGVAIQNPGAAAVAITVTGGGLGSPDMFSIPAGSSVTTQLPWVSSLSTSTATVKVVGGAYHIATSGPASALQLNAVEPASTVNDASLLLPVQSAGTAFRAVVWPTWGIGGLDYPGNIAIVATAAGTTVQVVAPGTIQAGAGLDASGGMVALDQGDVLLIASKLDAADAAYGSDLSGALITSDKPIIVWTGHAGTNIPAATGFADHLEEILPPISALGNDYFIVRPGDVTGTDTGSRYFVKVVGNVDGTLLTTDPTVGGVPISIDAGASTTFEATINFRLQTSQPVAAELFMEGAFAANFTAGDPSQTIAIPTQQARRFVDFIAPTSLAPIYAQIVAPTAAAINVDAAPVTGWTAIGSSGYSEARVALCCTDAHHASSDKPFLLSVHAYPAAGSTSYWYPGALGTDDQIFRNGFE